MAALRELHPYPSWLIVALDELGLSEKPGAATEARIKEFLYTVKLGPSDEIPWCAAFVNWVMEICGFKGTGSGLARSWLNWGKNATAPIQGAICIFKRGLPPAGHVTFLLDWDDNVFYCLGGNQRDRVAITVYPRKDLLGMRVPII